MKLISKITSGTAIVMFVVMATWSGLFYYGIIEQINDETDDALDLYSEQLIIDALAGGNMPSSGNGTNSTYSFSLISAEEAKYRDQIRYYDTTIYIPYKMETEPARVLETVFKDNSENNFLLTTYIPTIEKADLKKSILLNVLILFICLLISLIIINRIVLKRSLRPLDKLLKWLDSYNVTQDNDVLELNSSTSEFKKLYQVTNKSAERSRQFFKTQKEFIDNASHEMQTPIAVCKNRLEVLVQQEDLSEKQLMEIGKVQNTLGYMVKLNKSLLLLSKIENGQFSNNVIVVFNPIIITQIDDLTQLFEHKNLNISIKQEDEFSLFIDRSLATTLVSNLLRNAFIHANNDGEIKVMITPLFIEISNSSLSGNLSQKDIFNRFVKGGNNDSSMGLGLSIVKAICNLYSLNIEYLFVENCHHFKIFNK